MKTKPKPKLKPYSLAHNVSIEVMQSQGYEIVYDVSYFHEKTFAELNATKFKCSYESVLCAGGAAMGSDTLMLVSCGKCHAVLTEIVKIIQF